MVRHPNPEREAALKMFSRSLRDSRKYQKISQAQVIKDSGINRTHMYKLEHCHVMPGFDTLIKLCKVLGVDFWFRLGNAAGLSIDKPKLKVGRNR